MIPLIVCLLAAPRQIPEHPFAKLSGSFAVGVHEYHWADEVREETFTCVRDDHREVLVRVWYPADVADGAEVAPYVLDRAEYEGTLVARFQNVKSRSFLDAPFAEKAGQCPVLVFHHGAGWTRFSSSFVTEDLASHGYVVFGVEHVGLDQTRRLDGRRIVLDAAGAAESTGDPLVDAVKQLEFLGRRHFPVWLADSAFVIDRIVELNDSTSDRFFDRLDLDNLGMFGWSFGGAASIQASRDDARVKAAVDMDGSLFGDVAERGTSRPIMLMHSDHAFGVDEKSRAIVQHLSHLDDDACAALRASSTSDWYDVQLARSEHGHYSDLVLLLDRKQDGIDPVLAHHIICEYVRAFFDRYLRKEPAPLLAQDPSPFAQVTVQRRKEPR